MGVVPILKIVAIQFVTCVYKNGLFCSLVLLTSISEHKGLAENFKPTL